ncbi:hypothetical protein FisN_33Lh057 [Fistulifera solaris]|uniref:Phosphodiesterase n=1 Tax=Fistulifera solaris TaxID=1519565 RepID=A0A1Z5KA92_FISSO|nr:hypothetical protein FisN_33Lh057 [Fistulifera solaris]|eukprot:GAX23164.1 hypothetical protein FisN_33Lh057 [Fistulifera solaris]
MSKADDHSWSVDERESTSDGGTRQSADAIEQEKAEEEAVAKITALSVVVSTITFRLLEAQDVDEFEDSYVFYAAAIENAVESQVREIFSAGEMVAGQVMKSATEKNQTYPFVTVDLFEVVGRQAREMSGIFDITWCPIISGEKYDAFATYANEHIGWYKDSIALYLDEPGHNFTIEMFNLSDTDYSIVNPFPGMPAGPGPYSPRWQGSPPSFDSYFINVDAYAFRADATNEAIEKFRRALMSEVLAPPPDQANSPPYGALAHPVYDNLFEPKTDKIVGKVFSLFFWDANLVNLLPEGISGITAVLKNSCNQSFTYTVEGKSVNYVGIGDMHDACYDHMETIIPFYQVTDDFTEDELTAVKGHCLYYLHVYPSKEFENRYSSSNAVQTTTMLVFAFIFMITAFLMFDTFVIRRNHKLLIAMTRTNAIVSSMFPSNVRDRIFAQAKNESEEKKALNGKSRLKTFLSSGNDDNEMDDENDEYMYKTKPIADLFPETTVLFADLAGFTAWSSMREPTQVFILLETIYKAMDDIAKARRVFKVETVGDCYVAVTGLPDPRKDHAVAMCRFAVDCVQKMNALTKKLEVILGPDTTDLQMRVGLHSGPVTAGVLRGERSRFQLFGDTMNTASRMESNGLPGKIHISQETARLLIAAGKEHWVIPRDEKVVAKGKGELQTYWLVTTKASDRTRSDTASSETETSCGLGEVMLPEASNEMMTQVMGEKTERLVKWIVEVLASMLKKVIARRKFLLTTQESVRQMSFTKMTTTPLEEVQEIIRMPVFKQGVGAEVKEEELSNVVLAQLKEYVAAIASMYHNNPFHNFEHASHVTMSVVKLLSRIVAPDVEAMTSDLESALHDYTYGITSDPLTQFACVLSALIHDVDHPGVPNAQLIEENPQLARFYKDKSVAEQNSVDLSWELLQDNNFRDLWLTICPNESDRVRFSQLVVNSVMATDIMDKDLKCLRNKRWEKAFSGNSAEESPKDAVDRKATIVIEHLIQASDVAHTMQHWHIYRKWNQRLFEEMYMAYIQGRSATDPSENWYKGEIGFFDFYIIPLAKKLKDCGVFGVSSDEYLNYAEKNRQEWESRGMEVVAGMIEAAHTKYGTKSDLSRNEA